MVIGRETLEKEQAKTRVSESDRARLAIIRKQREEAAKRREEEAKGRIIYLI